VTRESAAIRRKLRRMFGEWSDRTFATYWRAWQILADLRLAGVISDEDRRLISVDCTRPNGSFNVCKFARQADARLMLSLDEEGRSS
jgi:hypothetical protein